jgi:hypothetical protein
MRHAGERKPLSDTNRSGNLGSSILARKRSFIMLKTALAVTIAATISAVVMAEGKSDIKYTVPLNPEAWEIVGGKGLQSLEYMKRNALSFDKEGFHMALLKNYELENGIIEMDIAASSSGKWSFPGIVFRADDGGKNYECIYFRPDQSGKNTAVQYSPAYNGDVSWTMYNAPDYEGVAILPRAEWFHATFVISGTTAEIYINNSDEPVYTVKYLERGYGKGSIGLWTFGKGYFANIEVTKTASSTARTPFEPPAREYLSTWWLSEAIRHKHGASIESETAEALTSDKKGWRRIESDHKGLVNMFRFFERKNTVFAVTSISSEKIQEKEMLFDHSGRLAVYLNSEQVYSGEHKWGDADLGRMFDGRRLVKLSLKKGQNELFMAVTRPRIEGWGFIARIDDQTGIQLVR